MKIGEYDAKSLCECMMNENTFTDLEEFIDYLNENIGLFSQIVDPSLILSYFERGCFVTATKRGKEKVLMFIQDIIEYDYTRGIGKTCYTFQEVTIVGCTCFDVYYNSKEGVEYYVYRRKNEK